MLTCIECSPKRSFSTTKALILHFQVVHKYNVSSIYRRGDVDILKNQADAFVSKFYCKPGLPRSIVQDIINDTESFLSDGGFMNGLKQKVVNASNASQADPSLIKETTGIFATIQHPFCHLKTEHWRFQHFMGTGNFIPPIEFELGKRVEQVRMASVFKAKWVKVTVQHVPLAAVSKKFLELLNVLSSILMTLSLIIL